MPNWGSWDDVESSGGPDNGWNDLAFGGYKYEDKSTGGQENHWFALQFPGCSASLNFFPDHPADGHQKCTRISKGKLKAFFEAAGCDKETMPEMRPDKIKEALDAYEVSGILIGCLVADGDRGYKVIKNFRKAK